MYFGRFHLDNEKDIIVTLFKEAARDGREEESMSYMLSTPNHNSPTIIPGT